MRRKVANKMSRELGSEGLTVSVANGCSEREAPRKSKILQRNPQTGGTLQAGRPVDKLGQLNSDERRLLHGNTLCDGTTMKVMSS